MDDYDQALKKLRVEKRSFNKLEELIGVPAETLRDIARGHIKSPRFVTLKIIAAFYRQETARV